MRHLASLIAPLLLGSLCLTVGSLGKAVPIGAAEAPLQVADAQAVQALASHLTKVGAKMYGAYWCPHCKHQKDVFGAAISRIRYIECDPRGENAQPQLCQAAKIQGYPTWEINGKLYPGSQSLEKLADLSGYRGSRQF